MELDNEYPENAPKERNRADSREDIKQDIAGLIQRKTELAKDLGFRKKL